MSSTDALSHCLNLSFLPQPGVKPTCQNNTTEHDGPPDTSRGSCCRKQCMLFSKMEVVSICSAQKFFGSHPSLNSWTSLLPAAPQTSWDFLVRILINVAQDYVLWCSWFFLTFFSENSHLLIHVDWAVFEGRTCIHWVSFMLLLKFILRKPQCPT